MGDYICLPSRPEHTSTQSWLRTDAQASLAVEGSAITQAALCIETFIDAPAGFVLVGAPTSYPPGVPVPYWPSVVVKPDTVRGVQTYFVNIVLDIIFGVFALAIGLSSITLTSSDVASTIAALAIVAAASCGLVIVFVINFILSLMSVIRMHHGANEYGPEHAANAKKGVMFKWIGTTLSTTAAVLVVYLVFLGTASFLGTTIPPTFFVPLLVTVFWTAGVGAKGQMYRYMVRSLQPPETRRWSDISSALIPALGVIGIVIVGYFTVRFLTLFSNPAVVDPLEASRVAGALIGGAFLPPGFALFGYVVYLWIYSNTKGRLEKGLMQLYSAVPPMVAWSYPVPPVGAVPPTAPTPPVNPASPPGPGGMQPPVNPMTKCPRCGFAAGSSDTFCSNCGAPLRA